MPRPRLALRLPAVLLRPRAVPPHLLRSQVLQAPLPSPPSLLPQGPLLPADLLCTGLRSELLRRLVPLRSTGESSSGLLDSDSNSNGPLS